jgi:hypothetical protein
MTLKILAKIALAGPRWLAGAMMVLICAAATSGCVSSTEPILGDARAILGAGGQWHIYETKEGAAHSHRSYGFQWDGRRYTVRGRAEIRDFTVHPYEGRDLIVQARTTRTPRPYRYALARKLADGVYQVVPIDAEDSDEAARGRFCIQTRDEACRIQTPEQLFVFARATAGKDQEGGTIAVLVRSDDVAPTKRRRRAPK